MDDLTQCSVIRGDFRKWLDMNSTPLEIWRGEKPLATFLKIFRQPLFVDYLFRTNGGDVSWKDSLTFCGVYNMRSGALYLTKDTASLLTGCSAPYVAECVSSMKEEIAGKINRQVEAVIDNNRKNLPARELTGWSAKMELSRYLDYGAKQEALHLFIDSGEPERLFHSDFAMDTLPEAAFMAYLQDPEDYIHKQAEQYIKGNQERFLLRFLKSDVLLAEFQALAEDTGSPIHRMRAITAAVNSCGGKSVTVAIQKDGKELTFKMDVKGLRGYHSHYTPSLIAVPDRREFECLFGKGADYTPKDITRITYGRNTIYEAAPVQTERPAQDIGGMRLG